LTETEQQVGIRALGGLRVHGILSSNKLNP